MIRVVRALCCALALALAPAAVAAPDPRADIPARDAGEGPYDRLVIRNVNLVDGTGAPMQGPFDVVVERDRIARIVPIGAPGAIVPEKRAAAGDREIDGTGFTLMPGFVEAPLMKIRNAETLHRLAHVVEGRVAGTLTQSHEHS